MLPHTHTHTHTHSHLYNDVYVVSYNESLCYVNNQEDLSPWYKILVTLCYVLCRDI